jgi:hypothetical protein
MSARPLPARAMQSMIPRRGLDRAGPGESRAADRGMSCAPSRPRHLSMYASICCRATGVGLLRDRHKTHQPSDPLLVRQGRFQAYAAQLGPRPPITVQVPRSSNARQRIAACDVPRGCCAPKNPISTKCSSHLIAAGGDCGAVDQPLQIKGHLGLRFGSWGYRRPRDRQQPAQIANRQVRVPGFNHIALTCRLRV